MSQGVRPTPCSVYSAEQIKKSLPSHASLLEQLATSFVFLASRAIALGPVSHINFEPHQDADCCIKSAYVTTGSTWVVKIAAGWYKNPTERGLPSSVGLMMVFCLKTGVPKAILLDGGYLTDLRTALAACVTARGLAPPRARAIGILGAGTIPRLLIETLAAVGLATKVVHIWARRTEAATALAELACNDHGWDARSCSSIGSLVLDCDVIFTCTPSRKPLLLSSHVAARRDAVGRSSPASFPGLHIHALGSDQAGKQEVEAAVLGMADLVVPDDPAQCFSYGECAHAKRLGVLDESASSVVALGKLLSPSHVALQRGPDTSPADGSSDRRFTFADSTGVGASDWAIAEAAYRGLASDAEPALPLRHVWKRSLRLGSKL